MTATITLSCDGHRHSQPCRGALPDAGLHPWDARWGKGKAAGWRFVDGLDLCPSAGHDEVEPC